MGRGPREKQTRLAGKLRHIREALGLSQNEILIRMGLDKNLERDKISAYELGKREPPLYVLLQYGRIAGVIMDVLADDDLDLPENLPCSPKHPGIPRPKPSGKK